MFSRSSLVGTRFGSGLMKARAWYDLRSVPAHNPEIAPLVSSMIIADRLITQMPRPGEGFLDIGAHIGSILAEAHRNTPGLRIAAIEAEPKKAAALTARFSYARIECCAIGETQGTARFYVDSAKSGFNSLAGSDRHTDSFEVEVKPLDAVFPDEVFDFIKMDIEGAELGALRGGPKLFQRCRPIVMFESAGSGANALGYSPDMVWDWFDAQGYAVLTPDRVAHAAAPLGRDIFLDAHHYPPRTVNFFAVPQEKRDMARDRARASLGVSAG